MPTSAPAGSLGKTKCTRSHPFLPRPLSPCRVIECRLLEEVLLAAARRFRAVKFVKIVSTAAVENWPDRNLPTLFVYHDGELRTQLLGIKKLGGRSTNVKGERAVTASGESEVLASKVLTRRCYARVASQTWSGGWRAMASWRRTWRRTLGRRGRQ